MRRRLLTGFPNQCHKSRIERGKSLITKNVIVVLPSSLNSSSNRWSSTSFNCLTSFFREVISLATAPEVQICCTTNLPSDKVTLSTETFFTPVWDLVAAAYRQALRKNTKVVLISIANSFLNACSVWSRDLDPWLPWSNEVDLRTNLCLYR